MARSRRGPHSNDEDVLSTKEKLWHGERNDRFFDLWSIGHLLLGILGGWLIDPFLALALLILWEPLEIFVLGPLSIRLFNKPFGHESWRNSMSDILFDAAGVAVGFYLLRGLVPL